MTFDCSIILLFSVIPFGVSHVQVLKEGGGPEKIFKFSKKRDPVRPPGKSSARFFNNCTRENYPRTAFPDRSLRETRHSGHRDNEELKY